jgi:hypothetical protein
VKLSSTDATNLFLFLGRAFGLDLALCTGRSTGGRVASTAARWLRLCRKTFAQKKAASDEQSTTRQSNQGVSRNHWLRHQALKCSGGWEKQQQFDGPFRRISTYIVGFDACAVLLRLRPVYDKVHNARIDAKDRQNRIAFQLTCLLLLTARLPITRINNFSAWLVRRFSSL